MIIHDSTQYKAAHGHDPKGNGYWWFASTKQDCPERMTFSVLGTYTMAKKAARKWAKDNGITIIYTLS